MWQNFWSRGSRPAPSRRRMKRSARLAVQQDRGVRMELQRAGGHHGGDRSLDGRGHGRRLGRARRDEHEVTGAEDRPDALWTRDVIEANRVSCAPPLTRIVVAVDPPASSSKRADACGIVAAGVDGNGVAHVLEDATASGLKPPEWAAKAVALYRRLEADALVVETNQGGEMATGVIREVCVEDAQPVEFGQVLFRVDPNG